MKAHKLRPAISRVYKEMALKEINVALSDVKKEVFNF